MSIPTALITLDNTLVDLEKGIRSTFQEMESLDPDLCYTHNSDLPKNVKAQMHLIQNHQGWWEKQKRLDLGFTIVEMLRESGFAIQIVIRKYTSEGTSGFERIKWCNQVPCSSICLSPYTIGYGELLVDNDPEYTNDWLADNPQGFAILIAQPWNTDFRYPNAVVANTGNLHQIKRCINSIADIRALPICEWEATHKDQLAVWSKQLQNKDYHFLNSKELYYFLESNYKSLSAKDKKSIKGLVASITDLFLEEDVETQKKLLDGVARIYLRFGSTLDIYHLRKKIAQHPQRGEVEVVWRYL